MRIFEKKAVKSL